MEEVERSPFPREIFVSKWHLLQPWWVETYFAFVEDKAIISCFLDMHKVAPPTKVNTKTEVQCLVS